MCNCEQYNYNNAEYEMPYERCRLCLTLVPSTLAKYVRSALSNIINPNLNDLIV